MVQDQNPKSWDPARFTHGHIHGLGDEAFEPDAFKQHTVIILNNPLENKNLLFDVCMEARCIVCADGGANRLYDLHLAGKEESTCVCHFSL